MEQITDVCRTNAPKIGFEGRGATMSGICSVSPWRAAVIVCCGSACGLAMAVTVVGLTGCAQGKNPSEHKALRYEDRLEVGMTYADVVHVLGEPEGNTGFGTIHAWWRIATNRYFVPTFEGDRVVGMTFQEHAPWAYDPPAGLRAESRHTPGTKER